MAVSILEVKKCETGGNLRQYSLGSGVVRSGVNTFLPQMWIGGKFSKNVRKISSKIIVDIDKNFKKNSQSTLVKRI